MIGKCRIVSIHALNHGFVFRITTAAQIRRNYIDTLVMFAINQLYLEGLEIIRNKKISEICHTTLPINILSRYIRLIQPIILILSALRTKIKETVKKVPMSVHGSVHTNVTKHFNVQFFIVVITF